MKNLIITATGAAVLALSAFAQAGIHRDLQHSTRDSVCQVLENTSRQIESELRSNLNISMPQLHIEEAGEFGVDQSPAQVDTHASNSGHTSVR